MSEGGKKGETCAKQMLHSISCQNKLKIRTSFFSLDDGHSVQMYVGKKNLHVELDIFKLWEPAC
jgi:hypothetical protein